MLPDQPQADEPLCTARMNCRRELYESQWSLLPLTRRTGYTYLGQEKNEEHHQRGTPPLGDPTPRERKRIFRLESLGK